MTKMNSIPQQEMANPVLPRLAIADGTLEAIKWLALACMTGDHVNKYLLHDTAPILFILGRLTLPLFTFVLACNLARPGALAGGAGVRTMKRLAVFGAIASVPFITLGGLGWGWWPLNVMAMLFVSTACICLGERGGTARIAMAIVLFAIGGGLVEFWWPGIAMCLAAWRYCKRPGWAALSTWILATAALQVINRNSWALAAFPLIFAAPHVRLHLPRMKTVFYAYYPAHLAILWGLSQLL